MSSALLSAHGLTRAKTPVPEIDFFIAQTDATARVTTISFRQRLDVPAVRVARYEGLIDLRGIFACRELRGDFGC